LRYSLLLALLFGSRGTAPTLFQVLLDTEPELESLDDFDIADILDDPAWPFTLPNHQLDLDIQSRLADSPS
jgi:hypothetical protein